MWVADGACELRFVHNYLTVEVGYGEYVWSYIAIEANESAAGYAGCHSSLADSKDVMLNDFLPHRARLLVGQHVEQTLRLTAAHLI